MNSLAFAPPDDGGVSSPMADARAEIIQRIRPARLSHSAKEHSMADPDEVLVRQSQAGDPAAFEELVRRHQKMIHSLTFRMTGSPADAEDLAQEAFIRAYGQVGSYRGEAKFSTWLYRITVNVCLNWRQREARRLRYQISRDDTIAELWAAAGMSPGENEQCRRVQEALLKLPPKQRAAIILTVYDGFNHAEAGKALGCSETTVSWRVFAARRKLKRWLEAGRTP
jgi:RNA polymerase sigma-70 factor (ECF subfamily)